MTNFAPKIKNVSNQNQAQMQVAIALLKEKRFDEAIAEAVVAPLLGLLCLVGAKQLGFCGR